MDEFVPPAQLFVKANDHPGGQALRAAPTLTTATSSSFFLNELRLPEWATPEMGLTIWSITSTVFLPLGFGVLGLLLSGYETLERTAQRICAYRICLGRLKLTLPAFIAFILALAFVGEWIALVRLFEQKQSHDQLHPLDFNPQFRAQQWRHQRNWWLALFSCLLWLVVWRASVLTRYFRSKISAIEKDKIEILKRVAAEVTEMRLESKDSSTSKAASARKRPVTAELEMASMKS